MLLSSLVKGTFSDVVSREEDTIRVDAEKKRRLSQDGHFPNIGSGHTLSERKHLLEELLEVQPVSLEIH